MIAKLVKPGDHVIDIGANYGVYMKSLSDLVGDTGRIYSVEPTRSTFDIISSKVRRLNLKDVRLMDTHSRTAMPRRSWSCRGCREAARTYMAPIVGRQPNERLCRFTIKTVILDSQFASEESAIAFIKCDVEGHELPCVSAAMQILRTCRPAWCVKVSGDPDEEAQTARSYSGSSKPNHTPHSGSMARTQTRRPA